MNLTDVFRIAAVTVAFATFGLALGNLIVSFKVLRPRPFSWRMFTGSAGGFLWSHVVFVTVPFQAFEAWGIHEVLSRIGTGQSLSWRTPLLFVLSLLISVGYMIIFRIELARLRLRDAMVVE